MGLDVSWFNACTPLKTRPSFFFDMLLICKTKEECIIGLSVLINLLRELGFSISWKKVTKISQQVTFLGVNLDSVKMEISLPEEKIQNIRDILSSFREKKRASKTQLSVLAGKMNFLVYTCDTACRTYMQRIFDLMRGLKDKKHKVILSTDFHDEIKWWLSYIEKARASYDKNELFL